MNPHFVEKHGRKYQPTHNLIFRIVTPVSKAEQVSQYTVCLSALIIQQQPTIFSVLKNPSSLFPLLSYILLFLVYLMILAI